MRSVLRFMLSSLTYQAVFGVLFLERHRGTIAYNKVRPEERIQLRSGCSLHELGSSAANVVPVRQLAISPQGGFGLDRRTQRHLGAGPAGKLKLSSAPRATCGVA